MMPDSSSTQSAADGRPGTGPGCKALHSPFDRRNPYQGRLFEALAELGIPATGHRNPGDAAALIARTPSSTRNILHLHWLPRGFLGPGNLLEYFRFALGVRRCRRLGADVFWTVHNLYTHESRNRRRERWLTHFVIRQAAGIIVHSERAGEMFRREFRAPQEKPIRAIPHGNYDGCYADTLEPEAARGRLGLAPEHRVVVFLGNIRPYKGVPELIQAFRTIQDERARLVIAGHVADDAAAGMITRATAEDPRIIARTGFVADEDIQVYMKAADAVALPYLNVLTSGACVLAMTFGRACIAPRSGCLPDFLGQQPELLYDANQPDGLRAALQSALSQTETTRRAGLVNRMKADAWTWSSVAQQTADFYRTASRRTNGPESQNQG